MAATRQTLQPLEGALFHTDPRLSALLPTGFRRRQDIGDGPVPLQGQTGRRGQGRMGEQEDVQRGGPHPDGEGWEDLFEGSGRSGGLV